MLYTLQKTLRISLLVCLTWFAISPAISQSALTYQTPPKDIADLVKAPSTPSVSFSRTGEFMLVLERSGNPSIEDLAQPDLRIAGMRINPATNGPSRSGAVENVKVKNTRTGVENQITGLPANARLGNLSISRDEKYAAVTNTTNTGISLWVVDLSTFAAKKLTDEIVNDVMGGTMSWTADNKILLKAINEIRIQLSTKNTLSAMIEMAAPSIRILRRYMLETCVYRMMMWNFMNGVMKTNLHVFGTVRIFVTLKFSS